MKEYGVLVLGAALLYLLTRKGETGPGPVPGIRTSGSVGLVRVGASMGTHGIKKLANVDDAVISVTYTVSALKNSVPVPWNYKLKVRLQSAVSSVIFVESAPVLNDIVNGTRTATFTYRVPSTLGFYNVEVSLLAATSSGGVPTSTYEEIASGGHLSAVEAVSAEARTSGAVGAVSVAQGGSRSLLRLYGGRV